LATPVRERALADVLIIGGGVNGAGIARDAAGRGLSVVLCEMNDLGSATSSASTKLIHGGLRYLEYYEFRLVRESLIEREVLLRLAPHIIWPLRFVLPHTPEQRPAWLIRLGLFLYDHLGGRKMLPGTRTLNLTTHEAGRALKPRFRRAFEYSDCWVEDSRLVALNAVDAHERGAEIHTRTRCVEARRDGRIWRATLQSADTGETTEVRARCLVNAAGPWVSEVLNRIGANTRNAIRLVKGSHIVVPRVYDGEHAYIFQNDDRRIVFAIPYEHQFTLIGTTDVDHRDDPAAITVTEDEVSYLCHAVSGYLARPVAPKDVIWSYSGVRPLFDDEASDASAVTRDYVLELDGDPPVLSVFGGKITTYRRLSEQATDTIMKTLGRTGAPWTRNAPLPGGDLPGADFDRFFDEFCQTTPWLPAGLARRYARAYGTRVKALLNGAERIADLGRDFGAGLFEAELRYAINREFVRTADDFLWRRTRMGLHVTPEIRGALESWFTTEAFAVPPVSAGASR
jgi:glycerol-3-phosphate dehydrogenase